MEVVIEVPTVEGMAAKAATVVRWLRKEGEEVRQGEPVVLVEFPKVELEIPAPASGKVSRILKAEGKMVRVHDAIGSIET